MYLTVKAHYHHVNGEVRVEREHLDVPSQVKTVSDLKSLIQAKMRIPADDMSLTYQGFLVSLLVYLFSPGFRFLLHKGNL